ncbi:hypothetical protein [Phyllobacterium zundukense]
MTFLADDCVLEMPRGTDLGFSFRGQTESTRSASNTL